LAASFSSEIPSVKHYDKQFRYAAGMRTEQAKGKNAHKPQIQYVCIISVFSLHSV